MRVIDVRSFNIPSDENDYDELVAFADTIANAHEFEAVPLEVIDKIRAEVERIEICGQIDEHSAFIRSGENIKTMVLDIIDKYKAEVEPQESEET